MIEIDPDKSAPATPKDAATVVILRDEPAPRTGFSVFMVRRHTKSAFMGGAYVFPGGKLDDADRAETMIARTTGLDASEAARRLGEPDDPARAIGLYIAAVRETFEEAGILLASGVTADAAARARKALAEDADFGRAVDAVGSLIDLDLLTPWTRWVTPVVEPRRYDTRFFLTHAPEGQAGAHDETETTESAWLAPSEALAMEARGEIQLPPPTLRSLEMLAAFDTIDAVQSDARSRPPPLVEPVFLDEDGTWVLTLPGDAAHPVKEPRIPGPTRFVLANGRWWSGPPK